MVLYFVGLGLGDAKDITVKGLEVVKKCERVYLEAYTSILTCGQAELEKFYGKDLILADRDMVEQNADEIMAGSNSVDVAFLVVGDPFGATTHSDLVLRAKEKNIPVKTIHNASIMNAVGCVGLQVCRRICCSRSSYMAFFFSFTIMVKRCPSVFGQTTGNRKAFTTKSATIWNGACTRFACWTSRSRSGRSKT